MAGDLTITGITKAVTFDVEVPPVSADRLQGSASAVIQRSDYDLQIPSAPAVADVDESVALEIEFVHAHTNEACAEMKRTP